MKKKKNMNIFCQKKFKKKLFMMFFEDIIEKKDICDYLFEMFGTDKNIVMSNI